MKTKKPRATKLKLDDIPRVYTKARYKLLQIAKSSEYKKIVNQKGISTFSEEELTKIENKYKNGMRNADIENELKNKGWWGHLKPSTIKHYLKVFQLPRPTVPRKKTSTGAVSLYPSNFMRHLNLVRFALNVGRDAFEKIKEDLVLDTLSDLDLLEMNTDDSCYERFEDFFDCFWVGQMEIEDSFIAYA